jgi:hypothetical protein
LLNVVLTRRVRHASFFKTVALFHALKYLGHPESVRIVEETCVRLDSHLFPAKSGAEATVAKTTRLAETKTTFA